MPSPEILEQEAYELLMSKHAGRSASEIGDVDDLNEDFMSEFSATDLLQMGYKHKAKEVMRANLALIEEQDDMHEILFKHYTTLKLYESNLAKFS